MIFEANGAMTYPSFRPLFHVWYEILLPYTARRDGLKHVLFDFERSISKSDLRSGQLKVRSRSGRDLSKSICISSEAFWWDKSFGTIRASLSPLYRELLAKKWLENEKNFDPGEPAPSFFLLQVSDNIRYSSRCRKVNACNFLGLERLTVLFRNDVSANFFIRFAINWHGVAVEKYVSRNLGIPWKAKPRYSF